MASQELRGDLVTLRLLQARYIPPYIDAFSPTVQKWLHCSYLESEIIYVWHVLEQIKHAQTFFYCMFEPVINRLIGAIYIRDQDAISGQLYSWLHESYWGTGRYQQAIALCAQEYFAQTMRTYFNAHVDIHNKRSYYALRKCGFASIGIVQGPYGKQHDMVLRRK